LALEKGMNLRSNRMFQEICATLGAGVSDFELKPKGELGKAPKLKASWQITRNKLHAPPDLGNEEPRDA
jgi:hypothetical protein